MLELNKIYCGDCLEIMKEIDDKSIDLVLTDPPYGLGLRTVAGGTLKNTQTKFINDLKTTKWDDNIPTQEVFDNIFRVSNNQIIFGANYFPLQKYRCFLVWDKMTYIPTMSRVELIYTSFDKPAKYYQVNSNQKNRVHPTQKPIELIKLILQDFTKENDIILDPFIGSGTTAIACKLLDRNFIGIEINPNYVDIANRRLANTYRQMELIK